MGLNSTGSFFFTSNFRDTNQPLYQFLAIPQAWSISLELMFYFFAPFIVRRSLKVIIPLIFLTFIARLIYYRTGFHGDPWTYRFFPFEIGFFLIGNVCYRVYQKLKLRPAYWEKLYLPLVFCILFITYLYDFISLNVFIKETLYYSLISVMIPVLFIASKNKQWDTYIGELSYLIYISHMLMLLLIKKIGIPYFGQLGITTLSMAVIFSIICNELVAKKIEKYRQKRVLTNLKAA